MSNTIITRFAPSPTGFLHIGGARTALFNWVYAKHTNGKMLLRIEDTDKTRSTQQALDAIINSLKWLQLNWDGEAISQIKRSKRHREVAEELVKLGKAYYCYASKEELDQMRQEAIMKGESPRYNGLWRDKTPPENSTIKPVIRLKSPTDGSTIINDIVQGEVIINNKELDDFIILRSDGTPTYMHAVVVDDHDMGVTNIIRGDDHLTNTAKQILIYKAMGWEIPKFAHIPLIHGEDGAKLSKRHGALSVEVYREMGYLPQALKNYLIRLGWSHGNDEIISTKQMIEWFDIKDINKGASRFDIKKLDSINSHYIKNTSDEDLYELLLNELSFLQQHSKLREIDKLHEIITNQHKPQVKKAVSILKSRAKTLLEMLDMLEFIFRSPKLEGDKECYSLLTEEAINLILNLQPLLNNTELWEKDILNQTIQAFLTKNNIKMPSLAKPLRVVLTDELNPIGLTDLLYIIGKNDSLSRINSINYILANKQKSS